VEYVIQEPLGFGSYGAVFKCLNTVTKEQVVIKRCRLCRESGIQISEIREITQLKALKHPNIVKLLDVGIDDTHVYPILEWVMHDLAGIIYDRQIALNHAQLKGWMYQILSAVEYIHKNNILHRDIKPSNILVNQDGTIKLADFGLSRRVNPDEVNPRYTNKVVTIWYRAPELLLGDVQYTSAIDIWAVGCILGELLNQKPLFPSENPIEVLSMIFQLCGTPESRWKDACKLPYWKVLKPKKLRIPHFKEQFSRFVEHVPEVVDLLQRMLELDPKKRITATEALKHPWFHSEPKPDPTAGR
jgi:serine/threonine protein kinase